ncbi:tyrosine-type recombinase/integrase [Cellulosimicrobium composti]|uniref:tyrosine-type recombinase/integrase n=1 Tax=Cellulosimicrobium composti TaxID=2672572 RepID=UPI00379D2991
MTSAGTSADQSKFSKVWTRAVRAADVGHVRPHDLRHTYASWLLQDGVPLARVGKLLGHVSPVTTQRYAHLDETPADDILAALERRRPRAPWSTEDTASPRGHLRIVR